MLTHMKSFMALAKGAIQGRLLDPKPLELPGCFDDLCGCGTGHLEILETLGCAITMAKLLTCLVSYVAFPVEVGRVTKRKPSPGG